MVYGEAHERLQAAWHRFLSSVVVLAECGCSGGVEPWHEGASGTLAAPLHLVSAAAGGYAESDLANIATGHGVPLVVAPPNEAYARVAGLELDDKAACVVLEHLPYLCLYMCESAVDNPDAAMRVATLRAQALEVIQASCMLPGFGEIAWAYEQREMTQRKVANH